MQSDRSSVFTPRTRRASVLPERNSLESTSSESTSSELISPKRSKPEVPIDHKLALTKFEAAEYSNIGINKIEAMLRTPNCPFVLYVGQNKKLVKRKEFEEFISSNTII